MRTKISINVLIIALILGLFFGCGRASTEHEAKRMELQVFIAASLSNVMEEIAAAYSVEHPDVDIIFHADSSGTLMTQIIEGYECDVFFSAAQKQMNTLEEEGLLVEGTRKNVIGNQVVLITYKGADTKVKGLEDIGKASSIAMADTSVPVGKYTREALVALGILEKTEDSSLYTTDYIQSALGGVEISEQSNVSKVLMTVAEHSCEIGTVYLSDTYGRESDIEIIEKVDTYLTGEVTYPIAQVKNQEASENQKKVAADFVDFVASKEAKSIFEKYYFVTDVE